MRFQTFPMGNTILCRQVKYHSGHWYISIVEYGESEPLLMTNSADPSSAKMGYPYHSRYNRAVKTMYAHVFGLADNHQIKLLGSTESRERLYFDDGGEGLQDCNYVIDGFFCSRFSFPLLGSPTDIYFADGRWHLLTAKGYYFVSTDGYEWYQYKYGFSSLNAMIKI